MKLDWRGLGNAGWWWILPDLGIGDDLSAHANEDCLDVRISEFCRLLFQAVDVAEVGLQAFRIVVRGERLFKGSSGERRKFRSIADAASANDQIIFLNDSAQSILHYFYRRARADRVVAARIVDVDTDFIITRPWRGECPRAFFNAICIFPFSIATLTGIGPYHRQPVCRISGQVL